MSNAKKKKERKKEKKGERAFVQDSVAQERRERRVAGGRAKRQGSVASRATQRQISVRQRRARQKFEVGCEQCRRLASNYKPMLAGDKDESCGRHKARQQKGLWLRRLAMGIKLTRCKNKTGAARLVWESLRGEARRPGVAERPPSSCRRQPNQASSQGRAEKLKIGTAGPQRARLPSGCLQVAAMCKAR